MEDSVCKMTCSWPQSKEVQFIRLRSQIIFFKHLAMNVLDTYKKSLMALLMGCHEGLGNVTLPTMLTLVWSVSSVVPHVDDQGGALGK